MRPSGPGDPFADLSTGPAERFTRLERKYSNALNASARIVLSSLTIDQPFRRLRNDAPLLARVTRALPLIVLQNSVGFSYD